MNHNTKTDTVTKLNENIEAMQRVGATETALRLMKLQKDAAYKLEIQRTIIIAASTAIILSILGIIVWLKYSI